MQQSIVHMATMDLGGGVATQPKWILLRCNSWFHESEQSSLAALSTGAVPSIRESASACNAFTA
jgi:hypothetical protein